MPSTYPQTDRVTAWRYDSWFDERWGRYSWHVESEAVLRALGPVSGRRIVDIGCGTARLAALLAAHGASVTGIDLDAAMLAVAASRLPGRLVRADAAALPLRDASVDAAVAVATLEFTVDPARVLGEMARITRSGGRVVAAVLNPASPWGWAGRVRNRAPYRGGCFLSGRDLLALGHRHGNAQIRGALFAAERLPLLNRLGPLTETIGTILPRLAAVQILTIQKTWTLVAMFTSRSCQVSRDDFLSSGDGGGRRSSAVIVEDAVGEGPGDAVDLSLKLKGRLARLPQSSMVLVGEVGTVGPYRNERNATR